jgi:hypothetical protein
MAKIDKTTRYTVHCVLAGAYKAGRDQKMLYHASQDESATSVCKKVKEYNLCDQIVADDVQVTCPVCLQRIATRGLTRALGRADAD